MAARSLAWRLRGEAAALRIQSAWRRHVARARFLRVQRAVLAIQAAYRGLTARHVASDLRCTPQALYSLLDIWLTVQPAGCDVWCECWTTEVRVHIPWAALAVRSLSIVMLRQWQQTFRSLG